MKKALFVVVIFALFGTTQSFSQVMVNDVNINDLDIKYVRLLLENTTFGAKVQVNVDYGQKPKFMKAYRITDANGEKKQFNSIVDILNFMYANGWKYLNYTETLLGGGKLKCVYLLEKKE